MQQLLPFTVLKPNFLYFFSNVANILGCCNSSYRLRYWNGNFSPSFNRVACSSCNSSYRLRYWNPWWLIFHSVLYFALQQLLPFTVLKQEKADFYNQLFDVATALTVYGIETAHDSVLYRRFNFVKLQQLLPFTVLKRITIITLWTVHIGCNSSYRLRYWNREIKNPLYNKGEWLQQLLPFTVLKPKF